MEIQFLYIKHTKKRITNFCLNISRKSIQFSIISVSHIITCCRYNYRQLLDRIKEANDIEEVKTILEDFENLVAGYYNEGGDLVIEGDNFNDFFGYRYDVFTYNFGYRFLYKSEFYGEMEIKK